MNNPTKSCTGAVQLIICTLGVQMLSRINIVSLAKCQCRQTKLMKGMNHNEKIKCFIGMWIWC